MVPLEQTFAPMDPEEYLFRSSTMWGRVFALEYTCLVFTGDGGFGGAEGIHMISGVMYTKLICGSNICVASAWRRIARSGGGTRTEYPEGPLRLVAAPVLVGFRAVW